MIHCLHYSKGKINSFFYGSEKECESFKKKMEKDGYKVGEIFDEKTVKNVGNTGKIDEIVGV